MSPHPPIIFDSIWFLSVWNGGASFVICWAPIKGAKPIFYTIYGPKFLIQFKPNFTTLKGIAWTSACQVGLTILHWMEQVPLWGVVALHSGTPYHGLRFGWLLVLGAKLTTIAHLSTKCIPVLNTSSKDTIPYHKLGLQKLPAWESWWSHIYCIISRNLRSQYFTPCPPNFKFVTTP